jgi:DNA repair exonuclease SbcCD nuclease subunit
VLRRDLSRRAMHAPVFYPGSVERVSHAERDETKGYVTLNLAPSETGGRVHSWSFHELS